MDLSLYGFQTIEKVFNLHPMFVHFPIALFPSALLFYFLGTVTQRGALHVAGRGCLYLGVLGGLIVVYTGYQAEESIPHNETIHHMMETHKTTGLIILGLAALLFLWSFWKMEQQPKAVWPFLMVLAFTNYLILQNGDLGARMVYVEGAGVKPAVEAVSGGTAQESGADDQHEHSGHSHGDEEGASEPSEASPN